VPAQYRVGLADRPADAGLQDDSRLPQAQWRGHPQGVLCRRLELFSEASVAIDGSKFKAVNTRDRNFTQAKMQRRLAQIDESIARYLSQLDSADRQGEAVPEAKITRLNERLRRCVRRFNASTV
jgi:hypothetical protein